MPSVEEIKQVLESSLSALPHDEDIDIAKIAGQLEGAPMSDVSFVIREASRLTAKNHLKSITQDIVSLAIDNANISGKEEKRTIGFH